MESSEFNELKNYIQESRPDVDLNTILNGNGTFILHRHLLSDSLTKDVQKKIGQTIGASELVPVGTEMSGEPDTQLVNCGYLDIRDKNFPEISLCWDGSNTICLIVSERTFLQLAEKLTKQTFQISFAVRNGQEPGVKAKLEQWISTKNMEFQTKEQFGNLNQLSVECKSDNIAREKSYITMTRLIMYTISVVPFFVGIMNYVNTMVTDILVRKQEIAVMESIGMGRRQLQKMLMLILLLICVVTPRLIYRQCVKESMIERMKKSRE